MFSSAQSRVTSLVAGKELLYVGTGGGAILFLNSTTMELCSLCHAYDKPVRCLLFINPGKQVKRKLSRRDSGASNVRSPRTSVTSLRSFDELVPEDRSVLVSFGLGYSGVVGSSPNHPQVLQLPTENGPLTHGYLTSATRLAKPSPSVGHLLLWSTEVDSLKGTYKNHCLDALEEHQEEDTVIR